MKLPWLKKSFLFTYGNYFWGYENLVIKAKNESTAVWKFLQPEIQTCPLKKRYETNGKMIYTIKDVINLNGYKVQEMEVI